MSHVSPLPDSFDLAPVPKDHPFTLGEYRQRVAAVVGQFDARKLDAILVFGPENLFYLTGYESIGYASFQFAIVTPDAEPQLFVRELEVPVAWHTSWMHRRPIGYMDDADPVESAVEVLEAQGLSRARVGLDLRSGFLTVAQFQQLVGALPSVDLVDSGRLVEFARRVKTSAELDFVRAAAGYTDAGMQAAMDAIAVGVSENQVAAAAASAILAAGSEYMTIDPIVTSGPRSGLAHTSFRRGQLAPGQTVLLEMSGVHHHYAGPLMRASALAPVPQLARRMYETCSRALDHAVAAIRPGVTSGSVHAACQKVIDDAGFEQNFRKRTGYSVGVGFAPDWGEGHVVHLSRGDPTVLEAGMVFHIPPALRINWEIGVGCSATVIVTKDGAEVVSRFPDALHVAA